MSSLLSPLSTLIAGLVHLLDSLSGTISHAASTASTGWNGSASSVVAAIEAKSAVAELLGGFSDWLERVSSKDYFYGVIALVAFLDAIIPIVPSETTVILGGIAAGRKELVLPLVIAAGAIGAFVGDNVTYELGARAGKYVERWSNRSEKGRKRLAWAKRQIETRGGSLLLTARFIPGGRTIITLASGITGQPRKRFRMFIGIAATIWATYGAVLGYAFGNKFKDNHNKALLLAFGCAISVTILIEIVRKIMHRNKPADH